MYRSLVSTLAFLAAAALALCASCGDLKNANDDERDDAGAPPSETSGSREAGTAPITDGGTPVAPTDGAPNAPDTGLLPDGAFPEGKGPGPHGSLPSGYCCTSDKECRYRHCVDTGSGGKMCLDECGQDVFCTRPDITFTCNPTGSPRLCKPSAGFSCLPAAGFTRGTKTLGACCNAGSASTNDGTAASQCEGNQCAAVGSDPLVCTHRCEFQSDCAGGAFACIQFGTSKACVPTSSDAGCL